ncbi:M4 family metallopeptidase [Streptomyces sp. NPDC055749]
MSDTAEFGAAATASGAVDTHMNAGRVFDYYQGLGRNGIDGNGGTMKAVVNVTQNGKPYGNAFWDGTKMVYGGMKGVPFSVGLDVVGHEVTHGITDHAGNMLYVEQSGALNEAVSDYFGEAMEADADGLATDNPLAGLIGENLCNDGTAPADCALRDLNDGRRADKNYLNVPLAVDNGGVHLNSSIVGGVMWDMRQTMDEHLADEIIYTALTEREGAVPELRLLADVHRRLRPRHRHPHPGEGRRLLRRTDGLRPHGTYGFAVNTSIFLGFLGFLGFQGVKGL